MAAGVITAAGRLNIKLPDQLSVAGFDDNDVAKLVWPPLTTVRQPLNDKARMAVEMLINSFGKEAEAQMVQLPVELIVRESTGPVPAVSDKA